MEHNKIFQKSTLIAGFCDNTYTLTVLLLFFFYRLLDTKSALIAKSLKLEAHLDNTEVKWLNHRKWGCNLNICFLFFLVPKPLLTKITNLPFINLSQSNYLY